MKRIKVEKAKETQAVKATRQRYRKPILRSTQAFERMALLSCGADSTQPEECDEL
ncbi:MAG: hypothetical protein VX223_03405 [Myxococcota bacterium]|nr:hypothetical protein [Myxococcota bacterium]